jgi:hypothetical protein
MVITVCDAMYYKDAPPDHQQIRFCHAVAASACVPGLFEPIVLEKLYEDVTVRLVGWLQARLHLHVFDQLFLRKGRIKT